jgi:hypothetical protein
MRQTTLSPKDLLVPRPCRFTDRVLARAFGASLDRQLAAGTEPETTPLLAARAQDIVSLPRRRALAGAWQHLLQAARDGRRQRTPAVPIQAAQIAAAEPAIRDLIARLTAPLPVTAQGVAMASVLLTDATGPVYRRRGPVSLDNAIAAVTAQLDPALPLMRTA